MIIYICTQPVYGVRTFTGGSFRHIRAFDWLDDRRGGKRLTKLPARQFIDTALTYIQEQLQDESLFPTKFGRLVLIRHSSTGYNVNVHCTLMGWVDIKCHF